jgi:hypothetical protein
MAPISGIVRNGARTRFPAATTDRVGVTEEMRNLRHPLGALLLALAACADPSGPLFPEVAGTVPPVPTDRSAIYFYRDCEPYESLALTTLHSKRHGVFAERFEVVRLLPHESNFQYRIKSTRDGHERVVFESELSVPRTL